MQTCIADNNDIMQLRVIKQKKPSGVQNAPLVYPCRRYVWTSSTGVVTGRCFRLRCRLLPEVFQNRCRLLFGMQLSDYVVTRSRVYSHKLHKGSQPGLYRLGICGVFVSMSYKLL